MNSRQTTIAGILAALAAILGAVVMLLDGDPATIPDWNHVATVIALAGGLVMARDNGKTSESVGARRP